jgi:hypothetical protein
MRRTRAAASAGFTLIEVVIGAFLLTTIGGIFLLTTQTTSSAVRTGVVVADLDSEALRVLERVCTGLKSAGAALATPKAVAPFSGTTLDYQRGLGADAAGAPEWGPLERLVLEYAEANDDVDDDGDGLVDESQLVWIEDPGGPDERRIVLTGNVREHLEGETFDGTDENDNGLIDERGFALDFDAAGARVRVRITLEGRDSKGLVVLSTVERTVAFRNTGI